MNELQDDRLRALLSGIRLLSLDTDGVLTDGGLYYADSGEEMRKFNVKDGLGMQLVQAMGIPIAIITASRSQSIAHRAERLGIEYVFLASEDKLNTLSTLCRELDIDLAHVAHVGDDLNDLPVFEAIGCPITVADATGEALAAAVYVTEKKGGEGAVREICDMLVESRSKKE